MKAAMALNCEIEQETKFDRKNYFYPDNPKAYQISQFDKPIGEHGWVEIEVDGERKNRYYTSSYRRRCRKINTQMMDIPGRLEPCKERHLVEIVSEPDIRTPEEAYAYLGKG